MTTGLAARAARPLFRRDANNIVKCKIDKSVAAVVLLIVMKSTHQSSSRFWILNLKSFSVHRHVHTSTRKSVNGTYSTGTCRYVHPDVRYRYCTVL